MNLANMAIVVALALTYYLYATQPTTEGFRSTKCFSCEAQDAAMGINRGYGTKCFSCEQQTHGLVAHPNKCFSCERPWRPRTK